MLRLACCAMAQLRVERLLATELVLDTTTVAVGLILYFEFLVRLVNTVRRSLLPFADALGLASSGLVLVHGCRDVEVAGSGGAALSGEEC